MHRTRKLFDGGPARSRASVLALGLVTAVAACAGGGPPGETDSGTGGPRTGSGGREGPTPSGKPLACSVSNDAAIGSGVATSPAIAFSGGRFATAWIEQADELHVAVFDAKGGAVGASVIACAHAAEPAATALPGGGFLVVWQEPGVVQGLRIGPDGKVMCNPFTISPTAGADTRPSTAAAAAGTTVAWADAAGVVAGDLSGDRIGGKIMVPGAAEPSLAASADGLGLAFVMGTKVGFARLPIPVRAVDPVTFRDAPGKANVPRAAAASDGGFYVVWEDGRGGDCHESVFLTHVGKDGKPAAEVQVAGDGGGADYPDVASLGGTAAVVYYQFRDGPPAVYLSLVGADLHPACEDLRISPKGARFPRIAAGDGGLGIVYAENGGPARLALVTCH